MIYLDNAATTFPKPERVYTALETANRELSFNAGRGSYKAARAASAIIDDTKNRLLSLFHATGYADIVFTPSVTHALNQVLNGLDLTGNSVIYVSPYEHNAVARTVYQLSVNSGASVKMLPLTKDLQIDLEKAKYQFSINSPSVVILNALSNVTGYILPVAEIFLMAREYGAITVLDAAQAAGLIDLDMPALNADVLCFAGHKTLMGPFGIGGFLIKHGITLKKVLTGGTGSSSLTLDMPEEAPGRYEASSTNVVAIAGLNASLKGLDINEHRKTLCELTEYLLEALNGIPSVNLMGTFDTDKTLGIVSFVVEGYQSDEVGIILDDEYDIAVRTGYHCAPYIHDYLGDKPYHGTIRIGIGQFNTKEDIDALISAIKSL
ncbi:aminotransferase class V-fold PLP-dependent enzyme [Neopoerus faecalis]|uniref:aminotransferase class V-fold PLP-dependent enzyme n=1 Tax=Neopoerus faecalis TaxID=3032125 RepID=UPI002570001C|nr:aminotransferase class V-fold PLP-dependent enzyme [Neopoerus faecalis]